ncbi:MAG: sigma-70 family RNA polymerase sigma factor [Clostridia bacterium]|nr:sigma-70 family RNA polymerase sigma factor [Clostridia bacterium]
MQDCREKDEALAARAQTGDRPATEEILLRYKDLVRSIARRRAFNYGNGDAEDFVQEGMIGLYAAISAFRPEAGKSFKNFACTCVERRILDAFRAAWRKVPFDGEAFDPDTLSEGGTPEDFLLYAESNSEFYGKLMKSLSDFEFRVVTLYLEGMSYAAIAETTGKDGKSIDNALARAKRKLQKVYRN